MTASQERITRANAVITVHKYEPVAYDEPAEGPGLTRIHVEESFSGDISGEGVVEFLQAARNLRAMGCAACSQGARHPPVLTLGEHRLHA